MLWNSHWLKKTVTSGFKWETNSSVLCESPVFRQPKASLHEAVMQLGRLPAGPVSCWSSHSLWWGRVSPQGITKHTSKIMGVSWKYTHELSMDLSLCYSSNIWLYSSDKFDFTFHNFKKWYQSYQYNYGSKSDPAPLGDYVIRYDWRKY